MFLKNGKPHEGHLPTIYFGPNKALSYVLNAKSGSTFCLDFLVYANHNYRYFDVRNIHVSNFALKRLRAPELDPRVLNEFLHRAPESFSIVRDPLRRFVSGFHEKLILGGDPELLQYRDMLTSQHGIDLSPEANLAKSCLAFAKVVATIEDQRLLDQHFRPQFLNLAVGYGFQIDTILKLEDRDSILAFFTKWIGEEKAKWFQTLRHNAQKYALEDFVTDELKELIRKIYAQDYALFYDAAEPRDRPRPDHVPDRQAAPTPIAARAR